MDCQSGWPFCQIFLDSPDPHVVAVTGPWCRLQAGAPEFPLPRLSHTPRCGLRFRECKIGNEGVPRAGPLNRVCRTHAASFLPRYIGQNKSQGQPRFQRLRNRPHLPLDRRHSSVTVVRCVCVSPNSYVEPRAQHDNTRWQALWEVLRSRGWRPLARALVEGTPGGSLAPSAT